MGGQGGCERRIEVFVKIQKKNWGGGGRVGGGGGGQGGCERRIEVFVKIQKIFFFWGGGVMGGVGVGGGGGVVRVDVNEELMFCENSPKKIGWGGSVGRSGRVGGSGWM